MNHLKARSLTTGSPRGYPRQASFIESRSSPEFLTYHKPDLCDAAKRKALHGLNEVEFTVAFSS